MSSAEATCSAQRRRESAELAVQAAKDYSHEVDMEVLAARRYRVLQTAEALRLTQVSGQ